MGFERVLPAQPVTVRQPCACDLPGTAGLGSGTMWSCDSCGELWVLNPYASGQYSLATFYEHVFWLTVGLPFLFYPFLWTDWFTGWRRDRWMRRVAVIGTVFVAAVVAISAVALSTR